MIPIIGVMIGMYIIARYFEMGKGTSIIAKLVLVVLIGLTLLCMFILCSGRGQ